MLRPQSIVALLILAGAPICTLPVECKTVATIPSFVASSTCESGKKASSIFCKVPRAEPGDLLIAAIVTHCPVAGYAARIIPQNGWMLERMDISGCATTTDTEQAIFWRNSDLADFSPLLRTYGFTFSQEVCTGSSCHTIKPEIEAVGAIVAYANTRYPRPLGFHDAIVRSTSVDQVDAPSVYSESKYNLLVNVFGYTSPRYQSAIALNPVGMHQRVVAKNGELHVGISDLHLTRSGWTPAMRAAIRGAFKRTSVGSSIIIYSPEQDELPAGDASLATSPGPPPTGGVVYYVNSNRVGYRGTGVPSGVCATADKLLGTSTDFAWCTIQRVNRATLHPGDQVLFKAGDLWRERLNPHQSGNSGERIVFGAYGTGPKPIISGADIVKGWTRCAGVECGPASSSIWYKDVAYPYIEGLYVTTSNSCPGPACPASCAARGSSASRAKRSLPGS